MSTIKVVLVDDHELMRQGLRAILEQEDDIRVIGETGSGESLLQQLQKGLKPDVVLMDLQMKGMSGVEATKQLKQLLPRVQVVGLSAQEDEHAALSMRRVGAFGYVIKAAAVSDLVRIIRAANLYIVNTSTPVGEDAKAQTGRPLRRSRKPRMPHNLTRRELDVVQTLMQGCSNKEIARQLVISERTVQTHLSNIFAKMQVTSRTEVVLAAINNGWLPGAIETGIVAGG
ncbi:MAG: response regulator transcription factor [Caldilineaceae bacterium]